MGQSTDGIICFGISFEEEFDFPWSEEDGIEEWWIEKVCGYVPSFEIYTDEGEYINGHKPLDSVVDRYYEERRKFEEAHRLPVKLIHHCSCDYPMYILTVSDGLGFTQDIAASRGYPEELDFSKMFGKESEWVGVLKKFCEIYGIEFSKPKWYLCSYWG